MKFSPRQERQTSALGSGTDNYTQAKVACFRRFPFFSEISIEPPMPSLQVILKARHELAASTYAP